LLVSIIDRYANFDARIIAVRDPMVSTSADRTPRQSCTRIAVVAIVALATLSWFLWPSEKRSENVFSAPVDVPIVMHTGGGRLEVATITTIEALRLDAPPKSFLGLDLGKTDSRVQVKVVFRYHIDMAKEWPIRFQGNSAVVEARDIHPTLPVAFDTSTMQKKQGAVGRGSTSMRTLPNSSAG
jgi:hypothetical protein